MTIPIKMVALSPPLPFNCLFPPLFRRSFVRFHPPMDLAAFNRTPFSFSSSSPPKNISDASPFSNCGISSVSSIDSPLEKYLAKERNDKRVLSIQSHVVSGFVGNKCAVFPLQLHGFEVDAINSVQFSNHTQYPNVRGQSLDERELADLFDGIRLADLPSKYSHILTGYCGKASFLRQIASIVRECRRHNPNLIYGAFSTILRLPFDHFRLPSSNLTAEVWQFHPLAERWKIPKQIIVIAPRSVCDPVMGDNGKYYDGMPREMCLIYRNEIFPMADVITPNAFELSELTGISISNESDALRAIDHLHRVQNVRIVVMTSGLPDESNCSLMYCYASEALPLTPSTNDDNVQLRRRFRFEIPLIAGSFVGTGDLFAALLLAWLEESGGNLCRTIQCTIASMQSVIGRTSELAFAHSSTPNIQLRELRLMQSRLDLLRPNAGKIKFTEIDG